MNNVRIISNYKFLHIGKDCCLSYRKGKLYLHSTIEEKPVLFGNLPMTKKQRIFSMFRLTERLFRIEPRITITINENEYLMSFCGSVYRINLTTGEIDEEHNYRQGMNNTMNFCKIQGINGFDDCIVYGEYWGNPNKEEVSIYSRKDSTWEKVYTFSEGRIKHIHGVIADPHRDCVLILTGDKDEESGIWIAKKNFKVVEPFLIGSQHYRACVAFPVEEGIIYATDSPLEKNVIVIVKKEKQGWVENVLNDIPGPCIYGTEVDGKYVFATSVEPDSRIQGIRYWFSYRLGQGVKERYSHIIMGNQTDGFESILRFKKDRLPMLLFQFGNVQFPSGIMNDGILLYPIGVKKYDGKTIFYNIY